MSQWWIVGRAGEGEGVANGVATMGTNGSQAATRGVAFNLIVPRNSRDRDQRYSTVIPRLHRKRRDFAETENYNIVSTDDIETMKNG